jgi:poly(A) polymerase
LLQFRCYSRITSLYRRIARARIREPRGEAPGEANCYNPAEESVFYNVEAIFGPVEPYILERQEHPISRRDIDRNVLKVLYRLIDAGFVAYLVGGAVRDLMLGKRPKDFDVGTSAHPHQVRELFRNSRLIGRRFRLIHVYFGQQNIEVATFRCRGEDQLPEQNQDLLIRQDNTFGTPEQDAERRDFTVNALFYDPRTFHVIDFVGGLPDIRAGLIRTVGDPEVRVQEDPVRMMRAVRFSAKLGFEIEPATRAAIERHRELLMKASPPRLVEEVYRAFAVKGADRALALAEQLGLLEVMLPRLSHHLRSDHATLDQTVTTRNVAALVKAIEHDLKPSHALALACLFVDLHMRLMRRRGEGGDQVDLLAELRQRGFARGDTEHMRLLMEALPHLMAPTRRTRSLIRRPNFEEVRLFYDLVAPHYPHDHTALERFVADPAAYLASQSARRPPEGERPRRRRRRRRGRSRSPGRGLGPAVNGGPQPSSEPQHYAAEQPDSVQPVEEGAVANDRALLDPSRSQ